MPKLIAFDAYGTLLDVYSMGVVGRKRSFQVRGSLYVCFGVIAKLNTLASSR